MLVKPYENFNAWYIDDFIPSESIVRAASESFNKIDEKTWVRYEKEDGQIQMCSPASRNSWTTECSLVADYIALNFDPNLMTGMTKNAFPDISGYGGGMMITPNKNDEGGFLGMHIDAERHALNPSWKRQYSVVLGLSEDYDHSFDLRLHNGQEHCRLQYKFNRLNIFKFEENSWHGFPEITKGKDRKTIGIMYWSIETEDPNPEATKARFKNDLVFR